MGCANLMRSMCINESINESINECTDGSIDVSINESINGSIDDSLNGSINGSTDGRIDSINENMGSARTTLPISSPCWSRRLCSPSLNQTHASAQILGVLGCDGTCPGAA